jgi:hypothetical protein
LSLLNRDQITNSRITDSDAGIILKQDGTFTVFNSHVLGGEVTAAQSEQMKKVMALAFALQTPEIMDMLYSSAADVAQAEGVVDLGKRH